MACVECEVVRHIKLNMMSAPRCLFNFHQDGFRLPHVEEVLNSSSNHMILREVFMPGAIFSHSHTKW